MKMLSKLLIAVLVHDTQGLTLCAIDRTVPGGRVALSGQSKAKFAGLTPHVTRRERSSENKIVVLGASTAYTVSTDEDGSVVFEKAACSAADSAVASDGAAATAPSWRSVLAAGAIACAPGVSSKVVGVSLLAAGARAQVGDDSSAGCSDVIEIEIHSAASNGGDTEIVPVDNALPISDENPLAGQETPDWALKPSNGLLLGASDNSACDGCIGAAQVIAGPAGAAVATAGCTVAFGGLCTAMTGGVGAAGCAALAAGVLCASIGEAGGNAIANKICGAAEGGGGDCAVPQPRDGMDPSTQLCGHYGDYNLYIGGFGHPSARESSRLLGTRRGSGVAPRGWVQIEFCSYTSVQVTFPCVPRSWAYPAALPRTRLKSARRPKNSGLTFAGSVSRI